MAFFAARSGVEKLGLHSAKRPGAPMSAVRPVPLSDACHRVSLVAETEWSPGVRLTFIWIFEKTGALKK
jgi:hypothetical protein